MRFQRIFPLLLLTIAFVPSCVDQDFDIPPSGGEDPNIEVTTTIAELKAMHTFGDLEPVPDGVVISGVIVSSDESGNFFRQLIVQDETGGIEIRVDATNLSAIYPPGRRIFVKCSGLWLGDFNNLSQLGAAPAENDDGDLELQRIPESVVDDYILRGTYGNAVQPKVKKIEELTLADVSTLIQLDEVQFIGADTSSTYADGNSNISFNLEIEDCAKDRVILRSSGFSTFANAPVPNGNGTIVGILGVFGSDLQLLIRDLDDVNMSGERCQLGGGNILTIQSLRDAFHSGAGSAPEGAIKGVVISDFSNGTVTGRNLYIQDASGGILVRFDANHSFAIGNQITVDVTGEELSEFSSLLQVNNVPLGNAADEGAGTLPAARVTTVVEILNNAEAWESTRIILPKATLSGNSVFNGNVTVTDETGSMLLFTRSAANFANQPLPMGEISITAIVSDFNAPQLLMAKREDVTGGTTGNGLINENFSTIGDNQTVNLAGWSNIAVLGERLWLGKVFDNNHYAQATAFNDAASDMEVWLITPAIDLNEAKSIQFTTAQAFWTHDGLSVWYSTDFDGENVTAANWTEWEGLRLANSSDTEHEFIDSGELNLPQVGDEVFIGFKYVGSGPGGLTSSYRIDDVIVREK